MIFALPNSLPVAALTQSRTLFELELMVVRRQRVADPPGLWLRSILVLLAWAVRAPRA